LQSIDIVESFIRTHLVGIQRLREREIERARDREREREREREA